MKVVFLLLFCSYKVIGQLAIGQYAVIIKPVVDCHGSAKFLKPEITASPLQGDCERLHQLKFNEIVKIKELKNNHALVECPSFFFTSMHGDTEHSVWILKDNLYALNGLTKKTLSCLPQAPHIAEFSMPKNISTRKVVSLSKPYAQFSVGTRFVVVNEDEKNYTIEYLTSKQNSKRVVIRKDYFTLTGDTAREKFVNQLRYLAHRNPKIEYVWGGNSCLESIESSHKKTIPLNGYDCSGLILSTAQLCGINYFYKNSLTASSYLEQVLDHKKIQAGDIIWMPGHVIIITDTQKNLCIEANGYYTVVHEIKLNKIFLNIDDFDKLLKQKSLLRMMPDGSLVKISKFKILKLPA
jgi:cell wall-associated NlpC family hydrolase